jgi:hypothetical protein
VPELPGRRGFEFAKAFLDSKVEPVLADFQKVDLEELGQFDVVLYLGVLYHMKEPLTCLERVRAVTKEVAVIETEAVHIQNLEHEALLQFHDGSTLQTDFDNWYVVTIAALHNMWQPGSRRSAPCTARPTRCPNLGPRSTCASDAASRRSHPRVRRPRARTTAPSSTPTVNARRGLLQSGPQGAQLRAHTGGEVPGCSRHDLSRQSVEGMGLRAYEGGPATVSIP